MKTPSLVMLWLNPRTTGAPGGEWKVPQSLQQDFQLDMSALLRITRGASLVLWLRVHLAMQGSPVQSLVLKESTWLEATKPVCHNYWAHTLEPLSHSHWSLCTPEPVLCNRRSHCNGNTAHCNYRLDPTPATRGSPRAAMRAQCSQQIHELEKSLPDIW